MNLVSCARIDREINRDKVTRAFNAVHNVSPLIERFHELHTTETAQLALEAVSGINQVLREILNELIDGAS